MRAKFSTRTHWLISLGDHARIFDHALSVSTPGLLSNTKSRDGLLASVGALRELFTLRALPLSILDVVRTNILLDLFKGG